MGKKKELQLAYQELRRQAEIKARLEKTPPEDLSAADCARLVYDLQVHQIELEMQNEELRRAQCELAESRDRYAELYDQAPSGYLTLDERGVIVEANLTAAQMLGKERQALIGDFFTHFLAEEERLPMFQKISGKRQKLKQQVHLENGEGEKRVLLLDIYFERQDGKGTRIKIALFDITEFSQDQEGLRRHQEELNELVAERSEELGAIFQASPVAIGIFDNEGKLVHANTAAERLFGWSEAELQGRIVRSIPETEPEGSLEFLQRALRGETLVGTELVQQRKDGSLFEASISVAPLRNRTGNLRGFLAMCEDITEHKRAEEDLRQSEELARRQLAEIDSIYGSAPVGLAVFDLQGRYLRVNDRLAQMNGVPASEHIGRTIREVVPSLADQAEALYDEVSHGGQSVLDVEFSGVTPGQPGMLRYWLSQWVPLKNSRGNVIGVNISVEEITERKRAEEALRVSREKLKVALDSANLGIHEWIISTGKIVWDERCRKLWGLAPEAPISLKTFLAGIHPEDRAATKAEIDKALDPNGHGKYYLEFRTRPGGGERWIGGTGEVFFDHGQPERLIGTMVDITERKQAEEMLRRQADLLELASNCIMVRDLTGRIVYWNAASEHTYGWSREEALGRIIHDLLQTEFLQPLPEIEAHLLEHGFWEGELVHTSRDGRKLPMLSRWALRRDKADNPKAVLEIQTDFTERKKAEENFKRQHAILGGINRIFQEALTCETVEQLGQTLLTVAEELTGSRFGFIGEINQEGRLDNIAISNLGWEACTISSSEKAVLLKNLHIRGLFGACLKTGQIEIVNDLDGHPERAGIPKGHPRLTSFLGMPLKQGRKVIGIVGLGNKAGGYTESDREIMEALAVATVQALQSWQAEEALRASENRFRAFMDHTPAISWAKDEDGRYIYLNGSFEDQMKLRLEDRLGKTDAELWPPEIAEQFRKSDLAALTGSGAVESIEYTHNPDGSRRWWWSFKFPFTGAGVERYVGGIALDITDRKRADEALAESEERYRSLFENNHAVMLLIDPESVAIVDANPAACTYYGYSHAELTAKKMTEINTLPVKQVRKLMKGACSGKQQQFFFQHRIADGTIRDVEIFSGPIMVKEKKLLYSIVHDITERRRAEEELHLSYQRLDLLAKTASELLSIDNPKQAIENICSSMLEFLHCEFYLNYLTDVEDKFLTLHSYGGLSDAKADRIRWIKFGQGVCGYTAQERRQVVVENIQESDEKRVAVLKKFGLKTYICHPMMVGERVLGTLGFGSCRRSHFTPDELGLMTAVTDQIALALDRQQSRQALLESEHRYRQLVEMAPDTIFVNQNGRIAYINPAGLELFGAAVPGDMIGRMVLDLVHPDYVEVVQDRIKNIYGGKKAELLEEKLLRLDGQPVEVEATAVPVEYRGQTSVQVMVRDITRRKETERALKQERDFSTAMLDTLGALVVVLDQEGRVVRFNHTCEILTGYTFAEVKGKHFEMFLDPEEKDSVHEAFQKVLQGDVPSFYENYWVSRSGEKFLISWSNTNLKNAGGTVVYLIGTGIDITRQRQAEEALRRAHDDLEERVAARTEQLRQTVDKLLTEIIERERIESSLQKSEARFAAFMKHLPGSAMMRDRSGRFLFANEAWELSVGRRPGESLGKTVDDLWPPEIAAKLKELDERVLAENRFVETLIELPVAGENRSFLSYRFPIRNRRGEVELIGAIGIDITERLKAEEARDRLIEIVEATPDFVGSADFEGNLFYLNQSAREILGLGKETELTNLGYQTVQPDWALEKILAEGKPVYMKEGVWQGETAIRRGDGSEIPVSQVILAHRGSDGRIKFFSTICRDISEMKRAEEQLRKSEEKLRQLTMQLLTAQEDERQLLAAELHDELGHALLILKMHLTEAEQKLLPEQEELKEKMALMVSYLTDTVEEVRRLYYSLSPGDLEDLGLTTALRNIVEDFQEVYPNINWQINIADIDALFPLPVQTIIYRIMQEVLTNIGKHAYPEKVKVDITPKDRKVEFCIQDDGRGFDMDVVLEENKRGMGLVAMAQRVSLTGGVFDVWSLENQGTRVTFNIPFAASGEKV